MGWTDSSNIFLLSKEENLDSYIQRQQSGIGVLTVAQFRSLEGGWHITQVAHVYEGQSDNGR